MRRSRRQNFASLPHALSNSSEKTHWNLSATMLRCSRSIWHSFGCFDSHIRNGSVGWMARKVQINQLVKSSYVCPQIRQAVRSDERTRRRIRGWAERQYHLTESLFNFREALQTITAFIYDPHHLLSDSDTTLYDALHVEANFKADWFVNRSAFQRAVKGIDVQAEEADVYCRIQQWRETRLSFSFDYREDELSQERFQKLYLCQPKGLRGIR